MPLINIPTGQDISTCLLTNFLLSEYLLRTILNIILYCIFIIFYSLNKKRDCRLFEMRLKLSFKKRKIGKSTSQSTLNEYKNTKLLLKISSTAKVLNLFV